jgi:hypothetical protein
MNNSSGVRRVQPFRDLRTPIEQSFNVQRAAVNLVLQRLAVEKFHGDEAAAVELVNFINRANVGMVQRRCGLRLALKAFQREFVLGQIFRQEFQRDKAPQLNVLSFVDYAHSSAAQFFQDAVVADGSANVGRSFRHRP